MNPSVRPVQKCLMRGIAPNGLEKCLFCRQSNSSLGISSGISLKVKIDEMIFTFRLGVGEGESTHDTGHRRGIFFRLQGGGANNFF